MSVSIAMCAPVTGLPLASNNLRVIVADPTRTGSGEISCSTATKAKDEDDDAVGREQPDSSKLAAKTTPASHLVSPFKKGAETF